MSFGSCGLRSATARARGSGTGVVQGVGFRPYVYRLAAGWGWPASSSTTRAACWSRSRARRGVAEFLARLAPKRRRWPSSSSVDVRRARRPASEGFEIRASPRGAQRTGQRRQRHLRGLPAGAVRSRRPPPPLSVHQLHQLRAALHDRPRRPLRPAADHDGRLPDVRGGARRSTRTRATAASTPSRTPAPTADPRCAAGPWRAPVDAGRDPLRRGRSRWRGEMLAVKGIGGYHLACRAHDGRL